MLGSLHTDVLVEHFTKSLFHDIMQSVDLVFEKGEEKRVHTYEYSKYLYCQALSFDRVRLYRQRLCSDITTRDGLCASHAYSALAHSCRH